MVTTIDQQPTYDDARIPPEVLDEPLGAMFSDLLLAEDAGSGAEIGQPVALDEPSELPANPAEFDVSREIDNPSDGLLPVDGGFSEMSPEAAGEPDFTPGAETEIVEIASDGIPASPFPQVIVPDTIVVPTSAAAPVEEASPEVAVAPEVAAAPVEIESCLEPHRDAAELPSCSNDLESLISEIDRENQPALDDGLCLGAKRAAAPLTQQDSCIVFLLGETRYAIPIRNVLELDAMPRITTVPNVPGFVRGVTNLRGEILAVLDLRMLLGLAPAESAERGRILIVRTKDQQTAALAVDEVRGTAAPALADLAQSPVQDAVTPFLSGVGEHQNRVLNVLDVDKLFGTPELRQLAAA